MLDGQRVAQRDKLARLLRRQDAGQSRGLEDGPLGDRIGLDGLRDGGPDPDHALGHGAAAGGRLLGHVHHPRLAVFHVRQFVRGHTLLHEPVAIRRQV